MGDGGDIVFIGFGEAGQAFAGAWPARAFDRKTIDPATAAAKWADYAALGVTGAASNRAAVLGAATILSLVTADQALAAARETAASIAPGALFCDMNSVAPDTKRAAAALIEAAGGRYADVAVMSPIRPAGRAAPLLVSGPYAETAAAALAAAGFAPRVAGARIGDASAIKMIRSVMVKGIEALSAECALAAHQAGVADAVIASLDASWPGAGWADRFDYNLDRMLIHGLRRAAEMDEVVKTLDALGTGSAMARGTAERQRAIGAIGRGSPAGIGAKIETILGADRPSQAEAA